MNFYEKCEFSQELTEFTKMQSEKFTNFAEFIKPKGQKFTRFLQAKKIHAIFASRKATFKCKKFTQFCEFAKHKGDTKSKKFTRFCNFANRKKIQAFHKNADERIEI